MLPRAKRLTAAREFARIYRTGQSAKSRLFRVSWDTRTPSPRVAVVASRKLSTRAVKRNLAKRRVRAAVARLFPLLRPVNLVIQLQPLPVDAFAFPAVETELRGLLERSGLLKA